MLMNEAVKNFGRLGKCISGRDDIIIKGMKALHLLAAVAWAGGAVSMQALSLLALSTEDPNFIAYVHYCRFFIDTWVVIPGLAGCILTGLFYSTCTSTGFFKFAWIGVKWIITINAAFWGLLFWGPWGNLCIEALAPWGLDLPLRFIQSFILPESVPDIVLQLAAIFCINIVSVYRPLSFRPHSFHGFRRSAGSGKDSMSGVGKSVAAN